MGISVGRRIRGLDELWDLRQVLSQTGPGLGLPLPLLQGLQRLLDCDVLSYFALDSTRLCCRFMQSVDGDSWEEAAPLTMGDAPEEHPFWVNYWSSRHCSFPDSAGNVHAVTLRSDFLSARQFRSTPMYVDHLAPFENELLMAWPDGGPGRTLRLLALRSGTRDFTENDRFLMQLLRPHLATAYRQSTRMRATGPSSRDLPSRAVLTTRQREVLALVRDGATNAAIGHRLGIAEGTARKHVENIHAALGVSSRAAAAAAADDYV